MKQLVYAVFITYRFDELLIVVRRSSPPRLLPIPPPRLHIITRAIVFATFRSTNYTSTASLSVERMTSYKSASINRSTWRHLAYEVTNTRARTHTEGNSIDPSTTLYRHLSVYADRQTDIRRASVFLPHVPRPGQP